MMNKTFQFLRTTLSKLNVFYQILFIIVMMIIFMTVQTINSNNAMKMIQQNTNKMYTNSAVIGEDNNTEIELEIEKIRINYLAVLANEASVASANQVNLNVLFNRIKSIKNIDESTNEKLDIAFAKIRETMSRPFTSANFATLNRDINNLQGLIRFLRNMASSNNYNIYLDSKTLSSNLQKSNLILVIVGAAITTLIGLLIAGFISVPLRRMVKRVKLLETGDLSDKVTITIGSLEVTEAIKGLNKAIMGLRGLITNISEQSFTLDRASAELSSISTDNGVLATEVAKSADELALASSEQVRQLTEAIESIQSLSDMVIQVTKDSKKIGDASSQVAQSAELGQKVTHDVAVEINALYDSTKEAADVINMLISSSEEISGITSIIEGIAEQTGLLALNASIEAARAGDHGRGFAVVAKEVAKLADRSKKSTRSISEIIIEIKARTDQAVEVMQQGISRAEAGKNLAEKAATTFQEINKTLMSTITDIDLVVKSTSQMALNNEKATEAVSAISAISEQNLASTEEVSAITQEQSASMKQVTVLADNLRQIASSLKQAVEMFELE